MELEEPEPVEVEEGPENMGKRKDDQDVRSVAVTGKPRPLDLTPKDAERLLDPPPQEGPRNLNLPDDHR